LQEGAGKNRGERRLEREKEESKSRSRAKRRLVLGRQSERVSKGGMAWGSVEALKTRPKVGDK